METNRQLITRARECELHYLWRTETEEAWTKDWRRHLSPIELAFVQQLDETAAVPGVNLLCFEALCYALEENLAHAI